MQVVESCFSPVIALIDTAIIYSLSKLIYPSVRTKSLIMIESTEDYRESSALELVIIPNSEALKFQHAILSSRKQEGLRKDTLLRFPIELHRLNSLQSLPIIEILSTSRDLTFIYQCNQSRHIPHDLQCACPPIRLLDECLLLVDQKILSIESWYCIYRFDDEDRALIRLQISLHTEINFEHSASLNKFSSILYHLETCLTHKTMSYPDKLWIAAAESARNSTCHVLRCRTHFHKVVHGDDRIQKKHLNDFHVLFTIADVFSSIITSCEADQMPIRQPKSICSKEISPNRSLIDLPTILIQRILQMLNARNIASISGVCSIFQHLSYEVVPGLRLGLFPHQKQCLKWMLYRERKQTNGGSHPFYFPKSATSDTCAIDFTESKLVRNRTSKYQDCRGGLLCDEPGLGKTVTMLALLLRTNGQSSEMTNLTVEGIGSSLRSSTSRGRSIRSSQLIPSKTTLIIVPTSLVGHWASQITVHVKYGMLRVYVDYGGNISPDAEDLAAHDIVITTFNRLTDEWRHRRPPSALEERAPDRYGSDGLERYANGQIRKGTSPFLMLHWVRIVVDEGHRLGVQSCSYQLQMAQGLTSDKRWLMTGTPTPNTNTSEDLKYLHGQLFFLRDLPLGSANGKFWSKAISLPFEKQPTIACFRLKQLLHRIMIRHTKRCVQSVPSEPVRKSVYIKAMPEEYAIYNAVASAVVTNLFLTNIDPKQPGKLHPDSLLNPRNRKYANQLTRSLRLACAGACLLNITLSRKSYLETIELMNFHQIEGDIRHDLLRFLRDAQLPGRTTRCGVCDRQLQLLIVLTCGHLVCAACVKKQFDVRGPVCATCGKEYDPEDLQRLQPGFELKWGDDDFVSDIVAKAERLTDRRTSSSRGRTAELISDGINGSVSASPSSLLSDRCEAGILNSVGINLRVQKRSLDFTKDFRKIWSSKACYITHRIRELSSVESKDTDSRGTETSTSLKVIVFSQFKEHIWRIRVSCAQQGIHCATFVTGLSIPERQRQLNLFRSDPKIQVLCLTDVGAHGLDLSFVSHIFFADEIWDKSLADQVISRAYRIGAKKAVVVEQLVMCGSLEEILHQLHDNTQSFIESTENASQYSGEEFVMNARHLVKNQYKSLLIAGKSSTNQINEKIIKCTKKASRLRQRVDYLLDNLRLLDPSEISDEADLQYSVMFNYGNVSRHEEHDATTSQKKGHSGQGATTAFAPGDGHPPNSMQDQHDQRYQAHFLEISHGVMYNSKGYKRKRVTFIGDDCY